MGISSVAYRATIGAIATISGLVALYLHLWKTSYLAQAADAASGGGFDMLQCAVGGGCVLAQTSAYSWFMGVDVALIGTVGYAAILIVSALGMAPKWRDARWPTYALMALVFPAILFTLHLKYGEFLILRTFCSWCAVSAIAITLSAILVGLDHRRLTSVRRTTGEAVGSSDRLSMQSEPR